MNTARLAIFVRCILKEIDFFGIIMTATFSARGTVTVAVFRFDILLFIRVHYLTIYSCYPT
jgi:hypothetical protein